MLARRREQKQYIRLPFAIFVCFSVIVSLLMSCANVNPAFAASPMFESKVSDTQWNTKSKIYLSALSSCLGNVKYLSSTKSNWHSWLTYNDAINGNWFDTGGGSASADVGLYMKDSLSDVNSGKATCNANLVKSALNLWGISSASQIVSLLCNSGFVREHDNNFLSDKSVSGCQKASNDFNFIFPASLISQSNVSMYSDDGADSDEFNPTDRNKAVVVPFTNYIENTIYGGTNVDAFPTFKASDSTDQQNKIGSRWYLFYRHTLNESCLSGIDSTPPSSGITGSSVINNVSWVDSTGNIKTGQYISTSGKDGRINTIGPVGYLDGFTTSEDNHATCSKVVNKMNSFAKYYAASVAAKTVVTPTAGGTNDASLNSASTCAVESVGWIICPIMNFFAHIVDNMVTYIENDFLKIEPSFYSNSGVQNAWSIIRNLANVIFIIMFMVIIYSQISGIGINNYGIKKLLPKLIIAIILVNLSFIICQVVVDLSNIVGSSASGFFDAISRQVLTTNSVYLANSNGKPYPIPSALAWVVVVPLILGGALVGIYLALPMLVASILPVIVAVILAVLIIVFRKAAIIILIVLSPVAFVLYLLPNTEKWFKKWQQAFLSLLFVYPIISIILGLSKLASNIIISPYSETKPIDEGALIVAMAVKYIPLFAIWPVLQGSMKSLGAIGAKITGATSKIQGKAKATGNDLYKNSRMAQSRNYKKQNWALHRAQAQGVYIVVIINIGNLDHLWLVQLMNKRANLVM